VTFKNKCSAHFAYVHPYTPTKSPKDLGGYWTKVHEIFVRRREIVDVKATIDVAIFPLDVE